MRTLCMATLALALTAQPVEACVPATFSDAGRYIGGDLPTQIASKAATIQVVRATGRHLISRTDNMAERFAVTGEWPNESEYAPAWAEGRYRETYVYEFRVVETLKGGAFRPSGWDHADILRIRARPFEEEHSSDIRAAYQRPWIFPLSRLDAPGDPFADRPPGAQRPASESTYASFPLDLAPAGGGDDCVPEFRLAIGDSYLVLRDEDGRPYFARNEDYRRVGGLPIEAQFGDNPGTHITFYAPALVRIDGPRDPYLARVRAALQQAH